MSRNILYLFTILLIELLVESSGYRLPEDLEPTSYKIHLDVGQYPNDPCQFSGKVWIRLKCLNDTENLIFNGKKIILNKESIKVKKLGDETSTLRSGKEYKVLKVTDIKSPKPHGGKGGKFGGKGGKHGHKDGGKRREAARIKLDQPLTAGSMYELYIEYNGTMNSKRTMGIYCSSYSINKSKKWMWSASFEPHLARTAFPSWDEPKYKAIFNISISHPNYTQALSNAPLASSKSLDDGRTLSEFEPSLLMSSYLVSFLVSEFQPQYSNDLKHVALWAPSKQALAKAVRPLTFASAHIKFFEEYTGIPDPTPKQDLITIPNYIAGGLENWGLISFDYKTVLLDKKSNKLRLMLCCDLVAHELAHVYFGNLVTPAWWNEIWLSEGFANYYSIAAVQKYEEGWNYEELSTTGDMVNAYESDSLPSTRPLVPDASQDFSMYDLFDDISYRKGSLIVRMLKYTLGDEVLRDGVRDYLKKKSYGSATSQDLWDSLQDAADARNVSLPAPLCDIMEGWTSYPGHPIVTVTRNYTSRQITLSQRSVLKCSGSGCETTAEEKGWWIPLTYTYESESDFENTTPVYWLSPDELAITVEDPAQPNEWLIFNKLAAGFYRVEYDRVNMDLLVQDLIDGNADIPLYNKILLIQDSLFLGLKLARTQQRPQDLKQKPATRPLLAQSLDLINGVRKERSESVWLAMLGTLHNLYYPLQQSKTNQKFKEYLRDLVGNEYRQADEGAAHIEPLTRWACLLDVPECTENALALFNSSITDLNNNTLSDSMVRYSVYCEGIRRGNDETWQLLYKRMNSTPDKAEAGDIARALACSNNSTTIKQYLAWLTGEGKESISGKIRADVLKSVSRNHPDLMLELIASNNCIRRQFSNKKFRMNKLLETLASSLTEQSQLEKFQLIVEDSSSLQRFSGQRDEITRLAESNINWAQNDFNEISSWLSEHSKNII